VPPSDTSNAAFIRRSQSERIPRARAATTATFEGKVSGQNSKRRATAHQQGGLEMTEVKIYPVKAGGWMYVVLVAQRAVVIGWCRSRRQAEDAAALV
jgi:hypothetical protein